MCIRKVITRREIDLKAFEARLRIIGGVWRIHQTVNERNVEKSRKWLLKHLIDNPENASFVESVWRTALLQTQHKETNFFMLDVDTQSQNVLIKINNLVKGEIFRVKTPKGYHIITFPFDTREICKIEEVSLLRDGYYYVKTVNPTAIDKGGK